MQLFVTTMPKTGTHLLWHILGLRKEDATFQEFQLARGDGMLVMTRVRFFENAIAGHIPWSKGSVGLATGFQKVTLLRDPRDTIISWHHFMDKIIPGHPFDTFVKHKGLTEYEGDERLMRIIEELPVLFEDFLRWLDEPNTLALRYENLLEKPEEELATVAEVLDEYLDTLIERAKFRGTDTFRKGKTGEWKHEFTREHLDAFDSQYEHIMKAWGYDYPSDPTLLTRTD